MQKQRRICNEFKKLGKCSKGDDSAYDHVAAAPEGSKKDKKQPDGAIGTPAIAFEEEDAEEGNAAACKDSRATFPCAPAKEKVGHGCTSARSALSSKVSVILLDSDEESETPADIVSDVTSPDESSEISLEKTTNSSYYEEEDDDEEDDDEEDDDEEHDEEEDDEDDDGAAATPAPEEEEDPSDEDGNPEPYNHMGPGRYCACIDFYVLKEGEASCRRMAEPDSLYCASCTHDSCDCICSDCRTSDCTNN